MSRLALLAILALAVIIGSAFALYPQLDLAVAGLFFDETQRDFPLRRSVSLYHARELAMWIARAAVLPAVAAVILKLVFPRLRALIRLRTAVLLIATLALGPGLIVNGVLKEHWGRPRPVQIVEFGGSSRFVPWSDWRGTCPTNCSFVSGDVATGFWTIAFAVVAPPAYRAAAYAAAFTFGLAVALQRMAVGAHFFTDVAFAALLTVLVIWLMHGLLFRRRGADRDDESRFEKPFVGAGLAIRAVVAAAVGRIVRLTSFPSRSR